MEEWSGPWHGGARGGCGCPTRLPWAAGAVDPPAGRVASTAFSCPSPSQAAENGRTPAPPVPRGSQTTVPPGWEFSVPPECHREAWSISLLARSPAPLPNAATGSPWREQAGGPFPLAGWPPPPREGPGLPAGARRVGVRRRLPAMLLGPWLVAAAAAAAVAAGAGAGCPVLCTCRGQAVDCSGQRLFSVPPELPLDTGNLSLAHNRIASIPPGYLACYGQLRALDLRNNSLAALPAGLFLGARRLAHLDLSYNNFSLVAADMFLEASGLLRLDLSHNPGLRRVHPQAFRGLAQLRELDLSYGGLSAISLDALEGLPGLVGLRLGGNPWVCGCAMEPFLKWLRGRIQRCASGRCHLSSPPRPRHQPHVSGSRQPALDTASPPRPSRFAAG